MRYPDEKVYWFRKESFGFIVAPSKGDILVVGSSAKSLLEKKCTINELEKYILTTFTIEGDFTLSAPLIAFIEVTRNCNLSCPHCYIDADHLQLTTDHLSLKKIHKILEELYSIGVPQIELTGGEPFLRQDLPDIINYCTKLGLQANVTTNGSLLTKEILEEISLGPTFKISFDSTISEDNMHGGAEIKELDKALKLLVQSGHDFYVVCSITTMNLASFPALYEWLGQRGVRVDTAHIMPVGRARRNKWLMPKVSDAEMVESSLDFFRKIRRSGDRDDKSDRMNFLNFLYNLSSWTQTEFCGKGMVYLDYKGDVFPCTTCAGESTFCAGNIFKNSFMDIWQNGFVDFRKIGWSNFKECSACEINQSGYFCPFRCPVMSSNLHDGDCFVCGATEFTKEMIRLAHKHD